MALFITPRSPQDREKASRDIQDVVNQFIEVRRGYKPISDHRGAFKPDSLNHGCTRTGLVRSPKAMDKCIALISKFVYVRKCFSGISVYFPILGLVANIHKRARPFDNAPVGDVRRDDRHSSGIAAGDKRE